jgi:hypothetical protein
MSKSNSSENSTLDALLRAVDPSFRANASRYIALYTADPGEGGSANTNECAYGSYARVTVTAATGFTAASGGSSSNTGLISFPECSSGSETVTYAAIVDTSSGAGVIIYSGALTSSRSISSGITPQFAIGALVVTED